MLLHGVNDCGHQAYLRYFPITFSCQLVSIHMKHSAVRASINRWTGEPIHVTHNSMYGCVAVAVSKVIVFKWIL